jgi:NitT/TauT family transport system substrate-binding protein
MIERGDLMIRRNMLLILVALFLVVPTVTAQDNARELRFFLTFVPNVQFSPVYVAIEKGYFAQRSNPDDQPLDVVIEHGDEPLGVDLIAAGELQFGLISGEQLLSARAAGRPVVFVYEWFQQYPIGIVTSADSGIESVADLAGRRVGIPGRFGATYSGLTALLAANDMTEADINLEAIGFNAPEVVCVGGVEASVVYINNEPLQIANRAASGDCGVLTDVRVFRASDAVDLVSNGIITDEATIADEPGLVSDVVTAFNSGLRDVIQNPAEAYLISESHVEGLPLDDALRSVLETAAAEQSAWLEENPSASREELADRRAALLESLKATFSGDELIQFEVLLATIDLWDADRLGLSDPESWAQTQSVLLDMGFMESPLADLDAAFTNDFLPPADEG